MSEQRELRDGSGDFDFLIGRWQSHHRRLCERLKDSTEWEEFEGVSQAWKILNGGGNFDEITMDRDYGQVHGCTLRLYNTKTGEWSIYWAATGSGRLDIPMIGRFEGNRGEFYAHEPFEGQHVFTRFIWTVNSRDSCRWEQAFSRDGGTTWETNWIMDFTRID